MPRCKVKWDEQEYDVQYSVSQTPEMNTRIVWSNPKLDEIFEELEDIEALKKMDAEITSQCGAHFEQHSGDDWKPGSSP